MATLIKAKKYREARQLVDYRYVAPRTYGGNEREGHGFSSFNSYARSIDEMCGRENGQRKYSMMASLIHERATNRYIQFSDVVQADVLLWIAGGQFGWIPRCLVYGRFAGKLDLFVRAATEEGYQPLRVLLQIETPYEFVQKLVSPEANSIMGREMFWSALRMTDCFNLEELTQRWAPKLYD